MGFPNSIRIMAWNLLVILILFVLSVLFFRGSVWVAPRVFPFILLMAVVTLGFCVLVLAPCAMFRKTRSFSATGLLLASFIFGGTTWLFAFMVVYSLWRLVGLIAGLVLGVIGVVPLALIAALTKGLWLPPTLISVGLVVTFAVHALAMFVANRLEGGFV
ncbi:MAG: hypothetical protein ACYC8V_02445 [Caulobacteraceae bacterium]